MASENLLNSRIFRCDDCVHVEACARSCAIFHFSIGEFVRHSDGCRAYKRKVDAAHWEDGCAIHNGKEVYKSIDCSHCEGVFKIESETREYWKDRFKVCPFCGAKMDGDGNVV